MKDGNGGRDSIYCDYQKGALVGWDYCTLSEIDFVHDLILIQFR